MIQGITLQRAMISAANCLSKQRHEVDALNIFPVPDGDTGSNMSMTMTAAARELTRLQDPTVSETAETAASALLRGARGNSGVILSLLFRGFAKGLKGKETANGADLAGALTLGVTAAYKSVMKPTEGTILTVAREAAEQGVLRAQDEKTSALDVWEAMCVEAEASLARTPDLLPVLKKAGVIDAGGQGFCIILRAMQKVFEGGEVEKGEEASPLKVQQQSAAGAFAADITFAYCTEFIVARSKDSKNKDPLKLRAFLESVGDSLVWVEDEDIIKVHVHTNDPGQALHEALAYGQFETVKVENMRLQHENAGWVQETGQPVEDVKPAYAKPENEYGFVSVAAGDGIKALFQDLGCDQVVSGGQTMNPSTDDILSAIEATPAKVVYVFPNNKNIILAAEQTIKLASRQVHVLPTRTIPQGVSALLAFEPEAEVKENLLGMTKAADYVSTGQITFASRDSDYDGKLIKEGQILALDNGKVSFVANDVTTAAVKLTKSLLSARKSAGKGSEFITIMYGCDVTEAEAEATRDAIAAKAGSGVDITLLEGGQPIYYYIISVE